MDDNDDYLIEQVRHHESMLAAKAIGDYNSEQKGTTEALFRKNKSTDMPPTEGAKKSQAVLKSNLTKIKQRQRNVAQQNLLTPIEENVG